MRINTIVVVLFLMITLIGTASATCSPPHINCMEVGLDWEPIIISPYPPDYASNGVSSLTYLENGIVLATTMYVFDWNNPDYTVCGNVTSQWGTFPMDRCALIHRSTDYGLTWDKVSKASFANTWSMAYLGNGIVSAGRFRSTDYGLTWTETTTIPERISFLTYVGNGIVIATNPDGTTPEGYNGNSYLYRSTDYGLTWTGMRGPPQTNIPGAPGFMGIGAPYGKYQLPNGIVLIADFYGKVYRSTDYGLTWDTGTQVTTQNWIWGFAINDAVNKFYAYTFGWGGEGVFPSDDLGYSWGASELAGAGGMTYVSERFYPPYWQHGRFILVNDDKVYAMPDGGYTWEEIAHFPVPVYIWSVVSTENGIVMASDTGSNTIWRSEPRMTENPQPPTVTSMFNTVSGSSEVATVIEGTSVDFTVTSDQSVTWYWTIARPSGTITTTSTGSSASIQEVAETGTTTITAYGTNQWGSTSTITWILTGMNPPPQIQISSPSNNQLFNTNSVTVSGTASDNIGVAGVTVNGVTATGTTSWSATVSLSEGSNTITAIASDVAGNSASASVTVISDTTPPIITGHATTSPNANNWYNTDVVVHFTASDDLSGIDSVTPDTIISTEGASQSVTGTATDKAGNSNSTTVSGINIDKSLPHVTINTPANGAVYILTRTLIADWSAIDSLSGIASATGTLPSGAAIDTGTVGTKTFTVTATDNAGNTATQTASYTIAYNFLGILPPIKTDGSSIFKSGSTVPVKFRIADANGNYVSTAIAHLTYQYITSDILGTVEEAISTSAANEGNTFRYDSTDSLYIFNLGTSGMNTGTYQLNINLDDGTVHTVRISLR